MKLFWLHLKQKKGAIALFVLLFALLSASFKLYGLPLAAVGYPTALCAAVAAVFSVVGVLRDRKRHLAFESVKKNAAIDLSALPEPESVGEQDLLDVIENLRAERAKLENDMNNRYAEMVDYYTVWAHQIKTPIAAMRLTLQSEDSENSRTLTAQLFKIEQYAEMVLTFLRLDSDSTDYVIKTYDLDGIVRRCVRKFAGEFIQKKLKLEYEETDIKVLTDEKWLSFVIEQVLSNSLKYTSEGYVRIYLKAPATLCIEDSGIGIAPEDLPRVFENGYTGYNGRTDMKASGIGLYLCRRICNNLGHSISAESAVGKGTIVYINLARRDLEVE